MMSVVMVGMDMGHGAGACLVRLDVPGTMMVLDNVGETISTSTGYGAAWLYGSNIYASTNEASSADLQNVVQFKNITLNSDHKSART